MRFQTKLYLFFSLTVLLPIVLVSSLAVIMYSRVASNTAYERLRERVQTSTVFLQGQSEALSAEATAKLKHDPLLVNDLISGSAERSQTAMNSVVADVNGAYAAVIDINGAIVGNTPFPEQRFDCNISTQIPLNVGGVTNSYLFVSRRLDEGYLRTLLEKTGEQSAVSCGGGVQASTFLNNVAPEEIAIDPIQPGEERKTTTVMGGIEFLTYQYSAVIEGAGKPFIFISAVPQQEVISNRSLLVAVGISLISFTLFVATLLAVLVTRTITNPLNVLTRAAVEAQEGNLDCRIDVTSRDEVGVLARSFAKMCSRLREHIDQLQESRTGMMRALSYASDILGSSYERDKLIKVVTETVQLATNAKAVAFYLIEHDFEDFTVSPMRVIPEDFLAGENQEIMEDMIRKSGVRTHGGLTTCLFGELQFLMVPVIVQKQTMGALIAVVEGVDATDESTCQILQSLASQTATAMENVNLNEALQEMVITDSLTGLRNNRYFNKRFAVEVEFSHRHAAPLSLIIIDLDNFKLVNDNYGHPVGDEVLRRVGKLLKNNVRISDIAARYGGEEFAILLPQTTKTTAVEVGEKLRILATELEIPGYPDIHVSFSVGVATIPDDARSDAELLRRSDEATYKAKELGKNQTVAA